MDTKNNKISDQATLEQMYKAKTRPLCPCRNPGIEMYIARIGEAYVEKRMPNTGCLHAPSCDSYEPPPELSGLGDVLGSAIKESTDDGLTVLKFDFSMSRSPGRAAGKKSENESDSVKSDGNKLTMRSTLHFLWEEAGFHKWSPAMEGKRSWFVIRKHLLQAAENKLVKGHPFLESLYIPEMFSADKKDAIALRRMAQMSRMTAPAAGARQLMMLVGEVKEIVPARYGHKIIIKHAADFPFMLNDAGLKRLKKRFEGELDLWESTEAKDVHLVAISTFSVGTTGVASIEEISLMTVNSHWVPFETIHDKALIEMLIRQGRRFTKGLRYNLAHTKPLACAVLTDTLPQPTALYIVPNESSEEFTAAGDQLREDSHLESWIWNTKDYEVPELPKAGKS